MRDGGRIRRRRGAWREQPPRRAVPRDSINEPEDEYVGSISNRAKFLLEVMGAVSSEIDGGRSGLRLSPVIGREHRCLHEARPPRVGSVAHASLILNSPTPTAARSRDTFCRCAGNECTAEASEPAAPGRPPSSITDLRDDVRASLCFPCLTAVNTRPAIRCQDIESSLRGAREATWPGILAEVASLVLRSVTVKVLAHSKIPVVFR